MLPNLGALPVHDRTACLELLEGDLELYEELLDMFRDNARSILEALDAANAAGDWDQVRMNAHSLKGSAANLSAERLRALATQLEECLRTGATVDIDAYAHALRRELDEFVVVAESPQTS